MGANVPYAVARDDYYGLLVYGDYAGNPALLVEIRQDVLARPEQQEEWAHPLAIDIALGALKQG